MKVHEALGRALVAEGIEIGFTVSGYGNLDLVSELADTLRLRMIACRHEQGAVSMADGYARVTGRPGFCTVTQGPGLTNTLTALISAVRRGSPVLLVAGHPPLGNLNDIQLLDHRRLVEATGAGYVRLRLPSTVSDDLRTAMRHVREGRGPAVLDAPLDVQAADVPSDFDYVPTSVTAPAAQRVHPDPEVIARALGVLTASRRIVILAGRGAAESGAGLELEALADELDALLATTTRGKGLFVDHPRHVGISGGLASAAAKTLFAQADCVLAFGASLNVYTTLYGSLFASAAVIQIDSDRNRLGAISAMSLGIHADALATATALRGGLKGRVRQSAREWFANARRALVAERDVVLYRDGASGVDPRRVVAALDELVPRDRNVVVDGGHHQVFSASGMSVRDPRSFIYSSGDFGAIGCALGLAMGAALGAPERQTLAFVGDGAFMMSLYELETAVRYAIPLTVVVMNDGAYGGEVRQLEAKGKPISATVLFKNPDFAAVARALGATGFTIANAADLGDLPEMLHTSGPMLLDVRMTREVADTSVEEHTTKAPWERSARSAGQSNVSEAVTGRDGA